MMTEILYRYVFTPKRDITAYELALVVVSGKTVHRFLEYSQFPKSVQRHFTKEEFRL